MNAAAAREQLGDLDGAVAALGKCDPEDLEGRSHLVEILVDLGDIEAAAAHARLILVDAMSSTSPNAPAIGARANEVLKLPSPTAPTIADARAALDAAHRIVGADRARARVRAQHAFSRAYGVRGEPVVVATSGISGRWAGDQPGWDVTARALHANSPVIGGFAIASPARTNTGGDRLVFTSFIEGTDGRDILQLPDHPSSFALRALDGIRVVEHGKPERSLEAFGTPVLSHDKRTLAVIADARVDLYDVGTWTHRDTIEISAYGGGSFTANDAYLLLPIYGSPPQGVVDVRSATIAVSDFDAQMMEFSDEHQRVVTLAEKSGALEDWILRIHRLGSQDPPLRVDLKIKFVGLPHLQLHGDRVYVVDSVDTGRMYTSDTLRAVLSITTGAKLGVTQADEKNLSRNHEATLLKTLEPALPAGMSFLGDSSGMRTSIGPDAEGRVAARTSRCTDPTCASSESFLLVLDANKKTLLHTVPLSAKDGFSTEALATADGGRFAFACGSSPSVGGAAFVVDVTTGRSTLLPGLHDCWNFASYGARVSSPEGIFDLGADQAGEHWPPLARVDSAPTLGNADDDLPLDGPGRYCRFGSVLEPLDTCASKF